MTEHLPPGPYDLAEVEEEETFYEPVWTVYLYERQRAGGQRVEIESWTFTDHQTAELHADKIIEDPDLDHEEYIYTVVIETGEQECPAPEPDWDSQPGGHDDF